jgi:hypothetical protein
MAREHTPVSVLDQCEGEDLNVCNVMVANSDGDGVFDRNSFAVEPTPYQTTHYPFLERRIPQLDLGPYD